jgi:hypothetical protein
MGGGTKRRNQSSHKRELGLRGLQTAEPGDFRDRRELDRQVHKGFRRDCFLGQKLCDDQNVAGKHLVGQIPQGLVSGHTPSWCTLFGVLVLSIFS